MDVDDKEGAIALRNAIIKCPPKEVLTGFTFEDKERSKFRYFYSRKIYRIFRINIDRQSVKIIE